LTYYNSDLFTAKAILENQLIWSFDSGKEIIMDLTNAVPSAFDFDGDKRFLLISH